MRAVLLDLEGTLFVEGEAVPGAAEAVKALRAAGFGVRFLTNIDSRTPAAIADELARYGLDVRSPICSPRFRRPACCSPRYRTPGCSPWCRPGCAPSSPGSSRRRPIRTRWSVTARTCWTTRRWTACSALCVMARNSSHCNGDATSVGMTATTWTPVRSSRDWSIRRESRPGFSASHPRTSSRWPLHRSGSRYPIAWSSAMMPPPTSRVGCRGGLDRGQAGYRRRAAQRSEAPASALTSHNGRRLGVPWVRRRSIDDALPRAVRRDSRMSGMFTSVRPVD